MGSDALFAAAESGFFQLFTQLVSELLEVVFVAIELDVHKRVGGKGKSAGLVVRAGAR